MNALSLFDGISCGKVAFQRAGIPIEKYFSYEIDKYAIKVSESNYPEIIRCGDVFDADFTQYEGIDYLIGGSPCTYWSIAQKYYRETEASGMGWELFQQYVRAIREAKPKYFLYENNKSMSKQIRASIDEAFGFEAILINSHSFRHRLGNAFIGLENETQTVPIQRSMLSNRKTEEFFFATFSKAGRSIKKSPMFSNTKRETPAIISRNIIRKSRLNPCGSEHYL